MCMCVCVCVHMYPNTHTVVENKIGDWNSNPGRHCAHFMLMPLD